MRKKRDKFNEELNELIDYINGSETDPNVVGYVLYNLEKKAFISRVDIDNHPTSYTGDVHRAMFFKTKFEAFEIGYFMEPYIECVPLLENKLFGLTPKPGSLDKETYLRTDSTNSDEKQGNK